VNRRGPILVGVASVVVVALAVFLLVLPKSAAITKANEDLATAQQQEQSLRVELAALQEAQKDAPQTRREIAKVEAEVPPTADLPGLIRLLRDAADRAAVDLFQFSPGVPQLATSGQYSTIPTAVVVTGSYFALDEFLYRLESLPRAAKVTSVQISPGGGDTTSGTATELNLQLTVEFYTSDLSAGPGSVPGPSDTSGA
jgi:Tfp pilus assembly protein PilO